MGAITYELRLNNVVVTDYISFTITRGRKQVQDPFRGSTASLSGLNLATVTNLFIGQTVKITATHYNGVALTPTYVFFEGEIANINADYGFNTNMDRWEINAEDAIAKAGRTYTSNSFAAGDSTRVAAQKLASGSPVIVQQAIATVPFGSKVSAQSFTNENLLSALNTIAATEQGRLVGLNGTTIRFYNRNSLNRFGTLINFTDNSVASTLPAASYQQITFKSRADSYFTETIVEPAGLAPQTAGTPSPTFTMQSYDETITQAANLAAYVLATLQVSQDAPAFVSLIAENNTDFLIFELARQGITGIYTALVTLRGVQYSCFVEGVTISADPAQTRFGFDLSSSEAAVGFILDDSILGVLDTSKLGF
jgi:hypothetical protein